MKKKWLVGIGMSIVLSIASTVTAFAGTWQQNETGWWYQNDDGTYPTNTWAWIDGNGDGISESYYFNQDGYILKDATTPDGYTVNADGAWVIDGVVQTQGIATAQAVNNESTLKLDTDFVKQKYVDCLGKDMDYAVNYLGFSIVDVFGIKIVGGLDSENGALISIYYTEEGKAHTVTSSVGPLVLLNADKDKGYTVAELDELLKVKSYTIKDEERVWKLHESPDIYFYIDNKNHETSLLYSE